MTSVTHFCNNWIGTASRLDKGTACKTKPKFGDNFAVHCEIVDCLPCLHALIDDFKARLQNASSTAQDLAQQLEAEEASNKQSRKERDVALAIIEELRSQLEPGKGNDGAIIHDLYNMLREYGHMDEPLRGMHSHQVLDAVRAALKQLHEAPFEATGEILSDEVLVWSDDGARWLDAATTGMRTSSYHYIIKRKPVVEEPEMSLADLLRAHRVTNLPSAPSLCACGWDYDNATDYYEHVANVLREAGKVVE